MSAFGIDIDEQCVCVFENGISKDCALDSLVKAVAGAGAVTDEDSFRDAVHAREKDSSTGIGGGVAIPHVRIAAVTRPILAVGISHSGIEFGSADGKAVRVVVFFAMPVDSNKLYLRLLAQVMVALKAPNFYERLSECNSPAEAVAVLNESGG